MSAGSWIHTCCRDTSVSADSGSPVSGEAREQSLGGGSREAACGVRWAAALECGRSWRPQSRGSGGPPLPPLLPGSWVTSGPACFLGWVAAVEKRAVCNSALLC